MTSPRLRKRKIPTTTASLGKTCICLAVVAFLMTCCIKGVFRPRSSSLAAAGGDRSSRSGILEDSGPAVFVDLWPDDRHTDRHRRSLPSCIPHQKENGINNQQCQVRLVNDDNGRPIQRVALVHPPGRLGDVFVEYVTRIVQLGHDDKDEEEAHAAIELVPTTHILANDDQYSTIIRMTTLPILLLATDVWLTHAAHAAATVDDLADLVRHLLRWECHMTQHFQDTDTALLTITVDRMMGFSSMTTRRIQGFLRLTQFENPKQNKVAMDDLSLIVMDVVDQGSDLIQGLLLIENIRSTASSITGRPSLEEIIQNVVDEELTAIEDASVACRPITSSFRSAGALTGDIVEKLLA